MRHCLGSADRFARCRGSTQSGFVRSCNYIGDVIHFIVAKPYYDRQIAALPADQRPRLVVFDWGGMVWASSGLVYDETDQVSLPRGSPIRRLAGAGEPQRTELRRLWRSTPLGSLLFGQFPLLRSRKASVCEAHHEGQGNIEPCNIAVVEATYRPPDPRPSNCHWLVGHDLGSVPQTISLARIDRDAKIRRVGDFRRHLTDDDRNMRLRKRIGLNDHRRPRFAVVARRGHDDDVTALHHPPVDRARQTRKPLRSNSTRRPRCSGRDPRLRRPFAGGQTAGVNRER